MNDESENQRLLYWRDWIATCKEDKLLQEKIESMERREKRIKIFVTGLALFTVLVAVVYVYLTFAMYG